MGESFVVLPQQLSEPEDGLPRGGQVLQATSMHEQLRTVGRLLELSEVFGVSQEKLMGLSGLTHANDDDYVEEAVRYAAKSASVEVLSEDEHAILNGLISVLSENAKHK